MNADARAKSHEALRQARFNFPGALAAVHVDVAAQGLISRQSYVAAEAILRGQMEGQSTKSQAVAIVADARGAFAQLIGATPGEIAITRNVSEGLNAILNALPWEPGDNLVFCPAIEHQNGISAVSNLRRSGIEIRSVPDDRGTIDAAMVEDALDERTRVVLASSVSFIPGFRNNLANIGALCRRREIFFLVDAVQSLGILRLDVVTTAIDGLAVSSAKGLLGLAGTGFLYCRMARSNELIPAYLSAQGQADDLTTESLPAGVATPLEGAARFHLGTPGWASLASVVTALNQILDLGQDRIECHCLALSRRLASELLQMGLPVQAPPNESMRSHIVTIGRRQAVKDGVLEDLVMQRIARTLEDNHVRFSVRRGMLRFAFHLYNDESDVDRIADLCRSARGVLTT